jgi:hypothetical protein
LQVPEPINPIRHSIGILRCAQWPINHSLKKVEHCFEANAKVLTRSERMTACCGTVLLSFKVFLPASSVSKPRFWLMLLTVYCHEAQLFRFTLPKCHL